VDSGKGRDSAIDPRAVFGSGCDQGSNIYPGNSGWPLLDDAGSVIGINTRKQVTYKFEGLGFAI
jgi:S1-C subfamily serine protease